MKLWSAQRAPNPRRVLMFIAEKGISGIDIHNVDLNAGAHRTPEFLAKSPLAKVPALELDDGRVLTETRAICTYLEGLYPQPNLMGEDATARAFIEMAAATFSPPIVENAAEIQEILNAAIENVLLGRAAAGPAKAQACQYRGQCAEY